MREGQPSGALADKLRQLRDLDSGEQKKRVCATRGQAKTWSKQKHPRKGKNQSLLELGAAYIVGVDIQVA